MPRKIVAFARSYLCLHRKMHDSSNWNSLLNIQNSFLFVAVCDWPQRISRLLAISEWNEGFMAMNDWPLLILCFILPFPSFPAGCGWQIRRWLVTKIRRLLGSEFFTSSSNFVWLITKTNANCKMDRFPSFFLLALQFQTYLFWSLQLKMKPFAGWSADYHKHKSNHKCCWRRRHFTTF